jgi:hypothetical protein
MNESITVRTQLYRRDIARPLIRRLIFVAPIYFVLGSIFAGFAIELDSVALGIAAGVLIGAISVPIATVAILYSKNRQPIESTRTFSQKGVHLSIPGWESLVAWSNVRQGRSTRGFRVLQFQPSGQRVYLKKSELTPEQWAHVDQLHAWAIAEPTVQS